MCNNEKPSLPRALNDAGNQLSVTWAPHKVRSNGNDSEVRSVTLKRADFGHRFTP